MDGISQTSRRRPATQVGEGPGQVGEEPGAEEETATGVGGGASGAAGGTGLLARRVSVRTGPVNQAAGEGDGVIENESVAVQAGTERAASDVVGGAQPVRDRSPTALEAGAYWT